MLKRIFQLLILLSLVFLIIYLAKIDYLVFNKISFHYGYLVISVLFLWLGFLLSTFSWHKALQLHKLQSGFIPAIYSHGIAVFAKYIPGKIWVILGRAAYMANKFDSGLKNTSTVSLKEQIIYILLGLLLGLIPFLVLDFSIEFKVLLIIMVAGLIIFLFSTRMHKLMINAINKITGKELKIPLLNAPASLQLSKYIVLYWICWIIAFYFFCLSIQPDTRFVDSLSFPLSVSIGVLALIFPGGIGVREGIIASYLISTGWENDMAVTASVISRIWFISGEVFIFMLALLTKLKK